MTVAAMLSALGPGRYWICYVALAAESSGTALAVPALRARIPAIVGTGPRLSSANSLNSFSDGAVRLIGGPIGGILFAALGIRVLIVADALSYLIAAGAIMMTAREASREPAARASSVRDIIRDLRQGLAILLRERSARALLPVSAIYLAANASLSAVVVAFGIRQLGGSRPTGFLFSALGVGFLVGAPILRMTLDRISARYLLSGQPRRDRRQLPGSLSLHVLVFSTACLDRGRHVRLHVAGRSADDPAARDTERGTRPDQRRVLDR